MEFILIITVVVSLFATIYSIVFYRVTRLKLENKMSDIERRQKCFIDAINIYIGDSNDVSPFVDSLEARIAFAELERILPKKTLRKT